MKRERMEMKIEVADGDARGIYVQTMTKTRVNEGSDVTWMGVADWERKSYNPTSRRQHSSCTNCTYTDGITAGVLLSRSISRADAITQTHHPDHHDDRHRFASCRSAVALPTIHQRSRVSSHGTRKRGGIMPPGGELRR